MITGESMPIEKNTGDTVIGATISRDGNLKIKAAKVGTDTMLSQIISMVEDAQGSKAPIEGVADQVSSVFVPIVLVIALFVLSVWALTGHVVFGFISMIGVLVIACPCALGLATPTAIIVGTGKGASKGILIKDAASLETLHKVTAVVFDKTGTLTLGKPKVQQWSIMENIEGVKSSLKWKLAKNQTMESYIASLVFALEKQSHHPLAEAATNFLRSNDKSHDVTQFKDRPGFGIMGRVDGHNVVIGTKKFLDEEKTMHCAELDMKASAWSEQAQTLVYISVDKKHVALMGIADAVKPASKQVVDDLHHLKIHVAMITGDHANIANVIGKELGIDTVFAGTLPNEKANKVKELQEKGMIVAMVGDGINDAPALAQADVGVAMGTGTDIAIEAADITLLSGDITRVLSAIKLSKETFAVIKQNLFWAFAYNVIGIPIAAGVLYPPFGIALSPVFAGAAMALSSVSVVTNSLRLKNLKLN